MSLRPSSLPKLAECPLYESASDAGKYADRGNRIDVLFREAFIAGQPSTEGLHKLDRTALLWAIDAAKILADGEPIETREAKLRVEWEGIPGTMDARCDGRMFHIDLKSGMRRNYRQQQAVYALGCMDETFVDNWDCYLLYCDEQEVVKYSFTRESAEACVREVLVTVRDPYASATPNEYCAWCARKNKCPERLETVAWFLQLDPASVDLVNDCGSDPERIAQSLALTYEIQRDGGIHDTLKGLAEAAIMDGQPLPGWRLQNGRTSQSVAALMLQAPFGGKTILEQAGAMACFDACGQISGKAFTALWETAFGKTPIPAETIRETHGRAFLAKSTKRKKAKAGDDNELS